MPVDESQFDLDGDGFAAAVDCDDTDPDVSPLAIESCNGADDDCDGLIDDRPSDGQMFFPDIDGDGFGDLTLGISACAAPEGFIVDDTDCDDNAAWSWPNASEICDDADNDCDGEIDENAGGTWYVDADGDGYGDPGLSQEGCDGGQLVDNGDDCDDGESGAHPAADELCNGVDDDCDGEVDNAPLDPTSWYLDSDSDGYGDAAEETVACNAPPDHVADATDCDDSRLDAYPDAAELCDGIDNDCNGIVDDDTPTWFQDLDSDGHGDATVSLTDCNEPVGYVSLGDDCDDGDATAYPSAPELCNGVDDDCSGSVPADEENVDGDSYRVCDNDCDDTVDTIYPGADEYCDGVDEDCDGVADNDAVDAVPWYLDFDGDGYGDASVVTLGACTQPPDTVDNSLDCIDFDDQVFPGQPDWFPNSKDDDCDGVADQDAGLGTGSDGDITVDARFVIDVDGSNGRSHPDGAVHQVLSIASNIAATQTVPDGIAAGDEVLLINLQGSASANGLVGTYEFLLVEDVIGTQIHFTEDIAKQYAESGNSTLLGQAVVVQRIPHYETVNVTGAGRFTTSDFDGSTGGIVAFRAHSAVVVEDGGRVQSNATGYTGGATGSIVNCDADQGMSIAGVGTGGDDSGCSNYNGANGTDAFNPNFGGGGAHINGGGGEYAGGAEAGESWNGTATPPAAGLTYGEADLDTLFFGSGGGGVWHGDNVGSDPGPGGNGGGIVMVTSALIDAAGARAFEARGLGTSWFSYGTYSYGTGAGSGGSVWVAGRDMLVVSGSFRGQGGNAPVPPDDGGSRAPRKGGDGGDGRIRIDFDTINGADFGSGAADSEANASAVPNPGHTAGF